MLSHQRLIRIFPSSNLINNFNTKINQIIDIKIIQTHHNDNVVFMLWCKMKNLCLSLRAYFFKLLNFGRWQFILLTLFVSITTYADEKESLDLELIALIQKFSLDKSLASIPPGEATDSAMFVLGRALFFSKTLSKNGDMTCASCHHPLLAGGDALSLPVGVDAINSNIIGPGRVHDGNKLVDFRADGGPNVPRNASTIFNIHLLQKAAFWDGRVEVIDNLLGNEGSAMLRTPDSRMNLPDKSVREDFIQAQAKFPITSIHEMFGHGDAKRLTNEDKRALIVKQICCDPDFGEDNPWLPYFREAFQDISLQSKDISIDHITEALSNYQRSMVFVNNPWFAYIQGDKSTLSRAAKRGALLFFKSKEEGGYQCNTCHKGSSFTDESFYNIAIPQFGRGKDIYGADHGRMNHTFQRIDQFKFRTPILLNVDQTGPWGHDGAFNSLKSIVSHHIDPITSLEFFDYSLKHLSQFDTLYVDTALNKSLSKEVLKEYVANSESKYLATREVLDSDVDDIVAFLKSLTDPCILSQECLSTWLPDNSLTELNLLNPVFSKFHKHQTPNNNAKKLDEDRQQALEVPNDSNVRWFSDMTKSIGLSYELGRPTYSDEYHLMGGGVAVDDINNDGLPDIFISHSMQPGKLFLNTSSDKFIDRTELITGGIEGYQLGALFFDYDADGYKDLLLVEDDIRQGYFRLYNQMPSGKFSAFRKAGINFDRFTHSMSVADIDADGDLDLFASHWGDVRTAERSGYLWQNNNGFFVDVSHLLPQVRPSPIYPNLDVNFTPVFTDFDNDNDPDILVAADYETSQILVNQGGKFVDATTDIISDENGMGAAVGDYDNDGDIDWFVTSIWNPQSTKTYVGGTSGNRLYQNTGNGKFIDETENAGVRQGYWGWGACFADFNNDGWLDLFHTNGMRTGQRAEESQVGQFYDDPSRLFVNNRDGTFTERAFELGIEHRGQGRGVSCTDFDKDGDIDVLIANNGAHPTYFRNENSENNHYFSVKLTGKKLNLDAVGAKIWLTAGGVTQFREIRLGSNYLSNNYTAAHFGLGEIKRIEKLVVRWPNGIITTLTDLPANTHKNLEQPEK